MSATINENSLWPRVAGLPLVIEPFEFERLHAAAPSAYNEDDPAGDLPASPLAPAPAASGFRWTNDHRKAA